MNGDIFLNSDLLQKIPQDFSGMAIVPFSILRQNETLTGPFNFKRFDDVSKLGVKTTTVVTSGGNEVVTMKRETTLHVNL